MSDVRRDAILSLSKIADALLRVVSLQDTIIVEYRSTTTNYEKIDVWQREIDELTDQLPIYWPGSDDGWQWTKPAETT